MQKICGIICIFQIIFLPLHRSVLVVPEAIQTIRCFFAHKQQHKVVAFTKNYKPISFTNSSDNSTRDW